MSIDMEQFSKEANFQGLKESLKVLIIHGVEDKTISVNDADKYYAVLPEAKLIKVEGADHKFTDDESCRALLNEITIFLPNENL